MWGFYARPILDCSSVVLHLQPPECLRPPGQGPDGRWGRCDFSAVPFWVVNAATSVLPEFVAPVLTRFSLLEHLRGFARGVVSSQDVVWFVAFTGVFLFLTWRSLDSRRWR